MLAVIKVLKLILVPSGKTKRKIDMSIPGFKKSRILSSRFSSIMPMIIGKIHANKAFAGIVATPPSPIKSIS